MNKEKQKEYEKYMDEQIKILRGHFGRIMLRLINKISKLEGKK